MKKAVLVCICFIIIFVSVGCRQEKNKNLKPELSRVKNICNLATLEVYYHNVAKREVKVKKGITHWFEKERKLWIEYTGSARVGIDVSKVRMVINDNKIKIFIPKAELLDISIEELDKDSYIFSKDGLINKNEITPEMQTETIVEAQKEMKKTIENDKRVLTKAQERAKNLIGKYIKQIGDLSGVEYKIEWELADINEKD